MTPARLRAHLAVTLSVAMDAGLTEPRRLAIVQHRLSTLIDQVDDDDDYMSGAAAAVKSGRYPG